MTAREEFAAGVAGSAGSWESTQAIANLPSTLRDACKACGSAPEEWCPDCAACEDGCFGGHDDNPCTHPRASWGGRR